MSVIALNASNAYAGLAKQGSQGVAVSPSYFPRWEDGTSIDIDQKNEDIREGGTRRVSFVHKNSQHVKIKHKCIVRPNEAALLEQAAMGSGSDAYTAPSVSTTLAAGTSAGATGITTHGNTGLTGSGTVPLVVDPGLAVEEIATFAIPATGSNDPYALTVANSGTLTYAHNNSAVVKSAASHVFTDQLDGSFYTWEISLGGTSGIIIRVRDCKMSTCKRSSKAGGLVIYETEWEGIACATQSSAATVTLDPHLPFTMTQGSWTLDGSTTGTALAVEEFSITNKNNLEVIQTEQLTPATINFTNLDLDVEVKVTMQNFDNARKNYFGSTTGTADSQTMRTGSLSLTFSQPDGFHTITYSIPSMIYNKTKLPEPKHDGKHFVQTIGATSTSNYGAATYLMQTTATNTTYSAF